MFFGKSGSGKTTFSDILMGLVIPTNVQILIDQNQIDLQSYSLIDKKIGYVPQNISLISGTLAQNISFNLKGLKSGFFSL